MKIPLSVVSGVIAASAAASTACGGSDRGGSTGADLASTSAVASPAEPSSVDTPAERARIRAFYEEAFYADSDVVHTFHLDTGEQVDCIDFYAQHSVKALTAAGQTVSSETPPSLPEVPATVPPPHVPSGTERLGALRFELGDDLDVDGKVRQCPAGTVAKRRPGIDQILAAGGVESFKKARASRPPPVSGSQSAFEHDCWLNNAPGNGAGFPTYNFEHAVGVVPSTSTYGLLMTTPVYAPTVVANRDEHTDSQLWAQTGSCENWYPTHGPSNQCTTGPGGNAVQSVEAGWITYTTGVAELMAFFTPDGYYTYCFAEEGGSCCPNDPADAPGKQGNDCWVEWPNAKYLLNVPYPTSAYGTAPGEISVQVWNGSQASPAAPGWWVWVNGNLLGWYPPNTFNWPAGETGAGQAGPMAYGPATYVQVGGEVYNTWPNNEHTPTSMVSDRSPAHNGYEYAAYVRNTMLIHTTSAGSTYSNAPLEYMYAPSYEGDLEDPGLCGYQSGSWTSESGSGSYHLSLGLPAGGANWGEYFYFGGGVGQ